MSAIAKTHLTEITIKQGKQIVKFKLPREIGRGLLTLLEGFQEKLSVPPNDDSIPAEDVFPDLKDPLKRIGIIFRGIRAKHNLTQAEVADRLGIDQSDVSKIEKGKRSIGKALAKKIQKEFAINYRRFL